MTMMSSDEVAAYLDCKPKTVEEAARSGRLPGVKYGYSWRFPRSALDEALHIEAMRAMNKLRATPLAVVVTPAGRKSRRSVLPVLPDLD
jgi:excisionase family DNA binding protein